MGLRRRTLLQLLGAGPLLAACSGLGPSAPGPASSPPPSAVPKVTTPATTPAPTTIQIMVGFGTGNAPPQLPVQLELADQYVTARRSGVSIDFLRVANATEGRQRLPQLIAAGQPPDIVLPTGRFGIFALADQDIWLDVSAWFKQAGLSLTIYPRPVQEAAQALGFYPSTGRMIGIPAGFHTHTLAFNRDLFLKARLPEPPTQWNTAEWTYERLRELAMKLTIDERGRNATEPGFDPQAIAQWGLGNFFTTTIWFGYGGRRYDPTARRAQFDAPETRAALTFAATLAGKDRALLTDALARAVAGDNGQRTLWRNGRVAMVDMCSCELPGYGDVSGFKWDIAAIPKGPSRLFNFLNVDVGSLVKPAKRHELAWDVLKFMTLDEPNGRRLHVDSYGAIPAKTDNLPYFREAMGRRFPGVNIQPFLDAIPYAGGDNEDWVPNYAQVRQMTNDAFERIVLGQVAATDELPRLQTAVQTAIDDWLAKFPREQG